MFACVLLQVELGSLRSDNAGLLSSLGHMEAEVESLHDMTDRLHAHTDMLQDKLAMVSKGTTCWACRASAMLCNMVSAARLAWADAFCAPDHIAPWQWATASCSFAHLSFAWPAVVVVMIDQPLWH